MSLNDLFDNEDKVVTTLPGAAVLALEAKAQGWRTFPFFGSSVGLPA